MPAAEKASHGGFVADRRIALHAVSVAGETPPRDTPTLEGVSEAFISDGASEALESRFVRVAGSRRAPVTLLHVNGHLCWV